MGEGEVVATFWENRDCVWNWTRARQTRALQQAHAHSGRTRTRTAGARVCIKKGRGTRGRLY